ncbi:MAG: glucose-1-phosphate adenylyltransferase [Candidatus Aminicenantes bacterium RBG_16_66_30]|nr:MAG: glucose-1-phosphate adenylyltransferase [Candidatus Aminicenantes bacterium RBG_16_66_30]
MASVVSVILAGGQGSRLYPLTKVRSKPAVPVAGRFRLIDISISNSIHSDIRSIFVLTQFASESLHRHIFTTYRFDSFHRDYITLLSAQQTLENRDWYQGTADAVRQNLSHLEDPSALVLILSGDHLYRMDYRQFVASHLASGAEISIAVTPVGADRAHEFGVMKADGRGRITEFFEKPKEPADVDRMRVDEAVFGRFGTPPRGRTHLASMGVYLFNQDVLRDLLAPADPKDFGREVIPRAIGERKVFGHFFDGYWEDIGTIRSFFEAHMDLTRPLPKFDFYDEERPIFTYPRFLPGSKILGAAVENAILCEGSIVNRSTIRDSIVGIRSRIGDNCRIERAVIMGSDFYESREDLARNRERGVPDIGIGHDVEIREAIIDKNARVGPGAKLVNRNGATAAAFENYAIVDGIIVVPKGAVIPAGAVI